ncbi:Tripartite tricarboxylate transporter TctB family protein [Tritonibacter multivorans]|uniref:Tripartite tricarboxylate transporter TctB family protein n=1 Tax=Tritonibacter multivorans TaxID=928856 RepID=A0A0P1GLG5_9RHOB|nr:tripartite tricarboxylate transporter TctB family protein [Tritonibacter multivorans]MDA7423030.1 tripartite tricarboxylate transporter TctB family protein [Tritonibacter multivorans]CUH75036.1 Tripartite tricarboxylate transporter TctB family protein [Tritonibacter multivorans]SFD79527.1 Tripartite tricarboxylate transporter TctB family protein [Tritonibacter multivorans]
MVRRWEIGIGLTGLLFALFSLFFWFPNDIQGAFMETTRAGKPEPGDAFFPVLLAGFIAFIAAIQIVSALLKRDQEAQGSDYPRLDGENIKFLALFLAIILGSLAVVYWIGPLAVWLTQEELTYRQLVDTAPYKYLGVVVGGFALTFSLISWAEGRLRARSAVVSALLILVLILVFDVALTNIQLPPNADF